VQRRRSVARANRASRSLGCPAQLGSDGQASGTFRFCQRDRILPRSKITSHSRSTDCSAGTTLLIWCRSTQAAARRRQSAERNPCAFCGAGADLTPPLLGGKPIMPALSTRRSVLVRT
jgi:hypothetical protein